MKTKLFFCYILIFLQSLNIYPQKYVSFGDNKFVSKQFAQPLMVNAKKIGAFSYNYLSKVGGVSFEEIITTDKNISIRYIPSNKDFNRLEITVDGKKLYPEIADWQLIPIANFSNTNYTAAVSLFGYSLNLENQVAYHEAFQNTLLGLRLFQSDIILVNIKEYYQLPTYEDNQVILGNGENDNFEVNMKDIDSISSFLGLYKNYFTSDYDSYLLTDKGRNVSVSDTLTDSTFFKSQKPYYYFWKNKEYKVWNEDAKKKFDSLNKDYETKFKNMTSLENKYPKLENDTLFNEYEFKKRLFNEYQNTLNEYKYEVNDILYELNDEALASQVKGITEYFETTYYSILERINPLVFKAVENTMNYSALFRYVKETNPENWQMFIKSIENIEVLPKINTPSDLYYDE
ncbi:MAG: hypothetical protein JXQ93_02305 [Flavobacteriaceae bacterium]